MINNVNPQYTYPYPTSSVGAVNIQIFNPTANPVAVQPAPVYPQASYYQAQPVQMQYPMNYNNQINQQQSVSQNTQNAEPKKSDEAKKDEKQKQVVLLTDEYVKSLENYLNNPNPKIRLMGAKELLERFKEDKTRITDIALTALLNKVLQDPKASVRFVGLTALDVGYALGDSTTINILKALQQSPDNQYGEDAMLASEILLKLSGQKVDVPINVSH